MFGIHPPLAALTWRIVYQRGNSENSYFKITVGFFYSLELWKQAWRPNDPVALR